MLLHTLWPLVGAGGVDKCHCLVPPLHLRLARHLLPIHPTDQQDKHVCVIARYTDNACARVGRINDVDYTGDVSLITNVPIVTKVSIVKCSLALNVDTHAPGCAYCSI